MSTRALGLALAVVLAIVAGSASAQTDAEPVHWMIDVLEEDHHLVLNCERFRAEFLDVGCRTGCRKRFRIQVAGEFPRVIAQIPRSGVEVPQIRFAVTRYRGAQQPANLVMDGEVLAKITAGGETVEIGDQRFDITGPKRTLIVDRDGRARESDVVLRIRTKKERRHYTSRLGSTAHHLHIFPDWINTKLIQDDLRQYSAADVRLLLQVFQQGEIVRQGLEEALRAKNEIDPQPLRTCLGMNEMMEVPKEVANAPHDGAPRDDKYDDRYRTSPTGIHHAMAATRRYRGNLAWDITEIIAPVSRDRRLNYYGKYHGLYYGLADRIPSHAKLPESPLRRPSFYAESEFYPLVPSERGVTIVFEGRTLFFQDHQFGLIPLFRGDAPFGWAPLEDGTKEIGFRYVEQGAGIGVNGGVFGRWAVWIVDSGDRLKIGESVVDLTDGKKAVACKYDGSIEVSDAPEPEATTE